ncbi:tryptophan halogenase family protein [Aurantiacibacter sp. D1-12]|uniref:tryptophan halogenase family protein n=1 Tax=Aurantiacibacter sp. D1-12 TaxID=2993658 RepID=UPI00237D2178|nr:tryptophan halogenase family protein [Aurantiacibacter sp. D1-12]MDE1467776.1 tryptophan 7-halogenase [Aurantiacibacter sp. D1-12]
MSENAPPHIVVLGGGSAGWITACLLHHRWGDRGGNVTVVESPEIGIIGVGEGSTPQLKAMFDHLGIAEAEWMAACDATYKLGIRFTGWSERPGFESYFHPFPGPVDLHTEPAFTHNCMLARRGFKVPAHPDDWFLATKLADAGLGAKAEANFPFAPSYGYHFDAFKLGAFLRDWAVARGVDHRSLKVEKVELSSETEVAALLCEGGERIEGDLFVDCSGFRAMIAGDALGGKFTSFGENLFNDRAVVVPTDKVNEFKPQTEAIAMKAGWRWHIPLTSRTGNGYVYSSKYISDEDAAAELLASVGLQDGDAEPRFLKMKVGRMAESWRGNCLAAGLAQGFVEPLEATALHIVIATALEFAEAFEAGGFTSKHRADFNSNIGKRYDGIRDYIVAHYRFNQRSDTQYWLDNAANQNLSGGLKAMTTAWFTHQDIAAANQQNYSIQAYSSASWHCLFAGYGTFPPEAKMQPLPEQINVADREEIAAMLSACAGNFLPVEI